MANHKSSLKRARQSIVRRQRNKSLKNDMRTHLKALRTLLANKKKDSLQTQLKLVTSKIQKLSKKGVIHNNTAGRLISRAATQVAALLK